METYKLLSPPTSRRKKNQITQRIILMNMLIIAEELECLKGSRR